MSKILAIDARCLEWQRGGVVRFLAKLLESIPSIDPNQKFILYFQNKIPDDDFLKNPQFICKIIRGPLFFKKRRIICEQILLPIQAIADSVNILFCPWYTAPLLLLYKKIILGAWDISFITHPKHYPFIYRISLGFFGKISCLKADRIITCSQFDARQIEKVLNISKQKILTLNFPAENKFEFPVEQNVINDAIERIGIKKPYILSLGVMYNRRNIPALIDAFKIVLKENENLHLLIVGRNATNPKINIKNMMASLISQKKAVYIEYLEEISLLPVYKGASMYYCSSDVDGESILLKEAMRSGVPILSSTLLKDATNNLGTYVEDPKDPVEIADSIIYILNNPEKINENVEKGKTWNRQISWDLAVKGSYDFITQI